MSFLRFFIVCFVLLGATCADAGVIVSQDALALNEIAVSVGDWDSSDSPNEEKPYLQNDQSQGMSATAVSPVKSSNSQALENSVQLFLPTFKPHCRVEYKNAELPPSPILDGLLKPS